MLKKTIIWFGISFLVLSVTAAVVFASVTFIDLKKTHWAHDSIMWGVENEVVQGYPDKQFKPEKEVTEAEFLKMLVSMYEGELPKGKQWYDAYYSVALELGWTVPGLIREKDKNLPLTRGSVAIIINNALGYSAISEEEYIKNLYNLNLSEGKTSKTVEGYVAEGVLSRAEAITFLKRVKTSNLTTTLKEPSIELGKAVTGFITKDQLEEALERHLGDTALKVYKEPTTSPNFFLYNVHEFRGFFFSVMLYLESPDSMLKISYTGSEESQEYLSKVLSTLKFSATKQDIVDKFSKTGTYTIGGTTYVSKKDESVTPTMYNLNIEE